MVVSSHMDTVLINMLNSNPTFQWQNICLESSFQTYITLWSPGRIIDHYVFFSCLNETCALTRSPFLFLSPNSGDNTLLHVSQFLLFQIPRGSVMIPQGV